MHVQMPVSLALFYNTKFHSTLLHIEVLHEFPSYKLQTSIHMEFCINTCFAYANTKKLSD